jgi:deuterolysin
MKFFAVAAVASLANAVSLDFNKRDSALDVKLELTGNTAVKAVITNTGSEDLKVLKTGSFLDKAAVEKVNVYQGCMYSVSASKEQHWFATANKVAFEGVKLRVNVAGLDEEAFQIIAAGETVEASFDVASAHDLGAGGAFDIVSKGTLNVAKADSTELTGVVSYSSNTITASVDGTAAAKVRRNFKRAAVQSDCTGTRRTQTTTALSNCRSLASAAATAARSNTAKLNEYFKSTSSSVASQVAAVFTRSASECGSTTSGNSKQYCTDVYGACSSNVLAYTVPSLSIMVNCPIYFSALPALTRTCHAQDQATTTLHESTHLTQVGGTDDLGYGYANARQLTTAQALNNADSYALFANGTSFRYAPFVHHQLINLTAIYAGC